MIEIDPRSGFCHGVVTAIAKAEEALEGGRQVCCLGDIVHNNEEVNRLHARGLVTVSHVDLDSLPEGTRVLLRAHGEPPSTYATAAARHLDIIDATCPVVLRLQQRIKQSYLSASAIPGLQVVIYGKPGHAEVNGLVGQTEGTAIVVHCLADIERIDFSRPVHLYSQTTMPLEGFREVSEEIQRRLTGGATLTTFDTICRQVANRVDSLRRFAAGHTAVLFVSGQKSSNGRYLYEQCLAVNPATHLVSGPSDIKPQMVAGAASVGVCGATSTPRWLMEQVAEVAARLQK